MGKIWSSIIKFINTRLFSILLLVVILFIMHSSCSNVWKSNINTNFPVIFKNPSLSYDEKMRKVWGWFYEYMEFIKNNTNSNSTVMYPHLDAPWLMEGNSYLLRYFLYPRTLVRPTYDLYNKYVHPSYVLICYGYLGEPKCGIYGWPRFPVKAKKILLFNAEKNIFTSKLSVYSKSGRYKNDIINIESVNVSPKFSEMDKTADRTVIEHDVRLRDKSPYEYFKLKYNVAGHDYWGVPVDIPLNEDLEINMNILSDIEKSVNIVAKVEFSNGKECVFGSEPNSKKDVFEALTLENLYSRAKKFALLNRWDSNNMKLKMVGMNTYYFSNKFYESIRYGMIEVDYNQPKKEISDYEKSLCINPYDSWEFAGLADIYMDKGGTKKAISIYEDALRMDPRDGWLHFKLGKIYQKIGKMDYAMVEYGKSVEYDSDLSPAYYEIGKLYEGKGNVIKAYLSYKNGGKYYGDAIDHILPRAALRKLEKKISYDVNNIKANDANTLLYLGDIYSILAKPKEAMEKYKEAKSIGADNVDARVKEGINLFCITKDDFYAKSRISGVPRGLAVVNITGDGISTENDKSYLEYSFPNKYIASDGLSFEFVWHPKENIGIEYNNEVKFLEQAGSKFRRYVYIGIEKGKLVFKIKAGSLSGKLFDKDYIVSSKRETWVKDNEYRILCSYKSGNGMYIYVNGEQEASGEYNGEENKKKAINLFMSNGKISSFKIYSADIHYFK